MYTEPVEASVMMIPASLSKAREHDNSRSKAGGKKGCVWQGGRRCVRVAVRAGGWAMWFVPHGQARNLSARHLNVTHGVALPVQHRHQPRP